MIFIPIIGSKTKKVEVLLDRAGEERELVVIFAGRGDDVIDLDLTNIHKAPSTQGKITVRGVLLGNARARIKGMVKIEKGAPKSQDFLEERTLLLGEGSSVEAIPELEIEEDDVTASHAASSAVVGEEELFYLRSRGLSEKQARKLIVDGFLANAIPENVEANDLKQVVSSLKEIQEYAMG